MWVQRWLARAGPGVSGKGDSLRRRLVEDLGGAQRAGWRWVSEGPLALRSRAGVGCGGDQRMQAGGARAGRAGRAPGCGQGGWAGRGPRPQGPLARWGQWESRVPLAWGEARLPRCSPVGRVPSARAAASGASGRLQGSRGSPRRRPPPLPSARRWSRPAPPAGVVPMVRSGRPSRGPSAERGGSARPGRGRAHLPGGCGAAPSAGHAPGLVASRPPGCAAAAAALRSSPSSLVRARRAGARGLGGEPRRGFRESIVEQCPKRSKDQTRKPGLPGAPWTRPPGLWCGQGSIRALGFSKSTPCTARGDSLVKPGTQTPAALRLFWRRTPGPPCCSRRSGLSFSFWKPSTQQPFSKWRV